MADVTAEAAMCRACGGVYMGNQCGHWKNASDMQMRPPCLPVSLTKWEAEQAATTAIPAPPAGEVGELIAREIAAEERDKCVGDIEFVRSLQRRNSAQVVLEKAITAIRLRAGTPGADAGPTIPLALARLASPMPEPIERHPDMEPDPHDFDSGWRDSPTMPGTADEDGRDMASAPKDGTPILITRPTNFPTEEGWHVVRWEDEDGEGWVCHDGKFDTPLRGDAPTKWWPLPARRTP